jgi:hypothetical protein
MFWMFWILFVFVLLVGGVVLLTASAPDPAFAADGLMFMLRTLGRLPLAVALAWLCSATGGWRRPPHDGKPETWRRFYPECATWEDAPLHRPTWIGRWFGLWECDLSDAMAEESMLQFFLPYLASEVRELSRLRRLRLNGGSYNDLYPSTAPLEGGEPIQEETSQRL